MLPYGLVRIEIKTRKNKTKPSPQLFTVTAETIYVVNGEACLLISS